MMQFKFEHTTRTVYERETGTAEWLYLGTYKQCGITDAMPEGQRIKKATSYSESLLETVT